MVAIFFILAALKVGVSVDRTFFQREPEIQIKIVKLLKLKLLTLWFDEQFACRELIYVPRPAGSEITRDFSR